MQHINNAHWNQKHPATCRRPTKSLAPKKPVRLICRPPINSMTATLQFLKDYATVSLKEGKLVKSLSRRTMENNESDFSVRWLGHILKPTHLLSSLLSVPMHAKNPQVLFFLSLFSGGGKGNCMITKVVA